MAVAAVLLYYLLEPRKIRRRWIRRAGLIPAVPVLPTSAIPMERVIWTTGNTPPGWCELRRNLPYQRWYADPARIRPRR